MKPPTGMNLPALPVSCHIYLSSKTNPVAIIPSFLLVFALFGDDSSTGAAKIRR
jgi:hypothetical protein